MEKAAFDRRLHVRFASPAAAEQTIRFRPEGAVPLSARVWMLGPAAEMLDSRHSGSPPPWLRLRPIADMRLPSAGIASIAAFQSVFVSRRCSWKRLPLMPTDKPAGALLRRSLSGSGRRDADSCAAVVANSDWR